MSWINESFFQSCIAQAKADMGDTLVSVVHTTPGTPDGYGDTTSGETSVTRQALVTQFNRLFRQSDGKEILSQHKVLFLEDVAIEQNHTLVLPDGKTGPILNIAGLDKDSGRYFTEVTLG